jgi:hypothetical protein
MKHYLWSLMIVSCAIVVSSRFSFADEPKSGALMQSLPADGVWATFSAKIKVYEQESLMTITGRSVGKVSYDGKQSRFIEYEQKVGSPPEINVPQLGNLTWRLLVPEEAFGEGKDPLSKASHKWVQYGTQEPEVVESIQLKDPVFATLLQGPRKNLKFEATEETIVWQQGELKCRVITGQNESSLGQMSMNMTHRLLRHPDIPFGVGGVHQDLTLDFGGGQPVKIVIHATLQDHGINAKAKLPNLVP